ncbi:MAG TPA: OmpA family protein [Chitinophagaceae bacterium]|nr:OmpA family protein [Chitinophagaceae bacterium]
MMKPFFIFVSLILSVTAMAQLPTVERNRLVLSNPVTFNTGSDELTEDGIKALGQVKEFLIAKDYVSLLRVEGHSDNSGDAAGNQVLTGKRALAVCKWLIANGIDCKRLIAVGFGGTKPIADNETPMGKAANRRMDFVITALREKLVGGMQADGGGIAVGPICSD